MAGRCRALLLELQLGKVGAGETSAWRWQWQSSTLRRRLAVMSSRRSDWPGWLTHTANASTASLRELTLLGAVERGSCENGLPKRPRLAPPWRPT
jgi:hypothetical protein